MAIKIGYYRQCQACNFEDPENEVQYLIWKINLPELFFKKQDAEYFADKVDFYLEAISFPCPNCNTRNSLNIAIQDYENFYNDSDYRPIISNTSIQIRKTGADFSECFIFNEKVVKKFLSDDNLEFRLDDGDIYLNIKSGHLKGKWICEGHAFSMCHDNSSESYLKKHTQFWITGATKAMIFMEEREFLNMLKLAHFSKPAEFAIENLSKVIFIDDYIDLDNSEDLM